MALFDDHRADWHARPPTEPLTAVPSRSRVGVTWHWAGPAVHLFGKPHSACLSQVNAWQLFHQQGRGWKDLGYNGLVCVHARAIEGRGVGVSASHSPSWNVTRWGIQYMVGVGERVTPAMFNRGAQLHRDLETLAGHDLTDNGHRDDPAVSTDCPGDQVYAWAHSPLPDPPPITAPKGFIVMLTLVKLKGQQAVWLSDLVTRRWVQTPAELTVVQANLKARGLPTTVHEVTALGPYGLPLGPLP